MFDVLAYVYDHYHNNQVYPGPVDLERRLNAAGFESRAIGQALRWLQDLHTPPFARSSYLYPDCEGEFWHNPASTSVRHYTKSERRRLNLDCLQFVDFLHHAGELNAQWREIVLERALATPHVQLTLDDLKVVVLLVYWHVGHQPSPLVLDELCESCAAVRAIQH